MHSVRLDDKCLLYLLFQNRLCIEVGMDYTFSSGRNEIPGSWGIRCFQLPRSWLQKLKESTLFGRYLLTISKYCKATVTRIFRERSWVLSYPLPTIIDSVSGLSFASSLLLDHSRVYTTESKVRQRLQPKSVIPPPLKSLGVHQDIIKIWNRVWSSQSLLNRLRGVACSALLTTRSTWVYYALLRVHTSTTFQVQNAYLWFLCKVTALKIALRLRNTCGYHGVSILIPLYHMHWGIRSKG